jgi:hypothetical protein
MMAHSNPYNLVYIYIITQDFEDSFELAQVQLFKSKGIPQYKSQRGCFFFPDTSFFRETIFYDFS